jgi:hypothetical protein
MQEREVDSKIMVINLTGKELDPAIVSILSKGLNFVHTPNSANKKRSHQWRGKSNMTFAD